MNLHGIASPYIGAVNPNISVSMQQSAGYTIASDGTQIPSYAAPVMLLGQVQELTIRDLQKLDGMNIQGAQRKIYLNGAWNPVVRSTGQGGDLATLPDATIWLVVATLELWPDWVCIAVTRQIS